MGKMGAGSYLGYKIQVLSGHLGTVVCLSFPYLIFEVLYNKVYFQTALNLLFSMGLEDHQSTPK